MASPLDLLLLGQSTTSDALGQTNTPQFSQATSPLDQQIQEALAMMGTQPETVEPQPVNQTAQVLAALGDAFKSLGVHRGGQPGNFVRSLQARNERATARKQDVANREHGGKLRGATAQLGILSNQQSRNDDRKFRSEMADDNRAFQSDQATRAEDFRREVLGLQHENTMELQRIASEMPDKVAARSYIQQQEGRMEQFRQGLGAVADDEIEAVKNGAMTAAELKARWMRRIALSGLTEGQQREAEALVEQFLMSELRADRQEKMKDATSKAEARRQKQSRVDRSFGRGADTAIAAGRMAGTGGSNR